MKISSKAKYKSLPPLSNLSLPDFVVLLGVNGAGKTHLLKALADANFTTIVDQNGSHLQRRKLVDANTLAPNDAVIITKELAKQSLVDAYNLLHGYKSNKQNNPNFVFENMTGDPKQHKIFKKLIQDSNKTSIDELSVDDIYEYYPLNDGLESIDVFNHNFSKLFKHYHVRLEENRYRAWKNQTDKNVRFLTEEQILQRYGEAPWDFVNKIIKEAKLGYHINSPVNLDIDAPYEFRLVNEISGTEVNFTDLSGGEKVLMSLALSLYNSSFDMDFPQVLLMDEPDAPLHPSMTKQFLEVIENVFVKGKNVKVIITTHSPSTVALAPEESLYQMNKLDPRIMKTTKDTAISILTSGVPSLSVTYENRRQVFVESKYDVSFYEKIYQKIKNNLVKDISINFISSGVGGNGNCDQVQDVVNKLSGFGNKFIYGIIDWDLKNQETPYVKILGPASRYSIENFILDPLLVSALLLREKIIDRKDFGLNENQNYTDFQILESAELQNVVDFYISKIVDPNNENLDSSLKESVLINGGKVKIPNWYLITQGHELEVILKTKFPQLQKFRNEPDLKNEIINKIVDDIPGVLSEDFIKLFERIQNYQTN